MSTWACLSDPLHTVPHPSHDRADDGCVSLLSPATPSTDHTQFDGAPAPVPTVRLMEVEIAAVTEAEAVQTIVDAAEAGRGHWTITANLDHVRRYHSNPLEKDLIGQADLVVADGMPLVWASRLAGHSLPERVSGSRMVWSICELAAARRQSVFLLGGNTGVAKRASDAFSSRNPSLQIAGTACPAMGFEHDELEIERLRSELIEASPQIVFVALGFPKQDLLIRMLRSFLPGASFVGVGISLSYVADDLSCPPDWVCRLGLEWAYRLAQEPTGRLARRYLIDGMPFGMRLMASVAMRRIRRTDSHARDYRHR